MTGCNDILTFTTPEHRWLSNMTRVDILHKGIMYPSTENFYQAMKYNEFDMIKLEGWDFSISVRSHIAYNLKPSESKQFSKDNLMTSTKFEESKIEIMRYAQRQKYKHKYFMSKLLATGDSYLEEGNWWHDCYWGCDIKTREGENNLGKIIMEVRSEIRSKAN